jgi:DNA polymerase III delta subunit
MLHCYFGTDATTARGGAVAFLDNLRDEGITIERIDSKDITVDRLSTAAGAVSLFGEQTAYFIDTPSESVESGEIFVSLIPLLADSDAVFVVVETTILAPTKKILEKHGATLNEYKRTETKERFDTFAIATALLNRDKKALWLLLTESQFEQIPLEETVGILWWQLKSLRLAAMTKSADEAGMKSYPYDKAKRALRNFKAGELEMLSRKLLAVHHEARSGKTELGVGLERWVLGV